MEIDNSSYSRTNHLSEAKPTENNVSIKKKFLYQASLLYTLANQELNSDNDWWNNIKDTHIILGAIPLKNKNHHTKIFNQSLQPDQLAVLTLLEPFEIYTKGPFSDPVTPKDWKKLGITQKIIPASDFNPLTQAQIKEAVHFIEKQDKQGIPTYVHCKAGRGRSATAVVCFLMKKYRYTAEAAKKKVQDCRNQINLNEHQWKAIKTYELFLNP